MQHAGKEYQEYAQRRVCFVNEQVPSSAPAESGPTLPNQTQPTNLHPSLIFQVLSQLHDVQHITALTSCLDDLCIESS